MERDSEHTWRECHERKTLCETKDQSKEKQTLGKLQSLTRRNKGMSV